MITVLSRQVIGRGLVYCGYTVTRTIDDSQNLYNVERCAEACLECVITRMFGCTR